MSGCTRAEAGGGRPAVLPSIVALLQLPSTRLLAPALLLLVACSGPPVGGPSGPRDTGEAAPCAAWTYDVEPTRWSLAAGDSAGTFTRAERSVADCTNGLPATRLLDLTGDDRLDFVVHSDCDDPSVGAVTWRVWPAVDGGFGAEIAWELPAGADVGAFAEFRDAAECTDKVELPAFRLAHLDADRRIDLVITEACSDTTLASGAWRVYPNTGTGFDAGEVWPISPDYTPGAFSRPRDTRECNGALTNIPAWGVLDLDGDGPVDIVLTDTCDRTPTVESPTWSQIASDGSAFTPKSPWTVPSHLRAFALAYPGDCGSNLSPYFLLDVEGDGLPDLVVPQRCDSKGSEWTVHTNRGTGFAAIGELKDAPWSLNREVDQPEGLEPDCTRSRPAWVMDDADGDLDADLTVTASCTNSSVGDARWDLHDYTREGWSPSPVPINLPTGYTTGSFAGSGVGSSYACAGTLDRPAWVRRDLTGDGKPDLVVTQACADPSIGVDAWWVYEMLCLSE